MYKYFAVFLLYCATSNFELYNKRIVIVSLLSFLNYYTAKLGDSLDADDSSRNSDLNFIKSRPR